MFLDLIRLYNKNGGKIPLEDFNTEAFANILKMHPKICKDFCSNFLKLEEDNYTIKTQYHQHISTDSPDCIVDLVFIGNSNVCFIENKVESTEGTNQLSRYVIALKENHSKKKKHLVYCTKYAEHKIVDEKGIHFSQFRWYEVANFLVKNSAPPLIQSYLQFLNYYKMSHDNTLKSENFIAMENMQKTIEIIESHIENSKPYFQELFGGAKSINKNTNWDQIKDQNRICYHNDNVLKSETNKYSEILYAIEFEQLKILSQIYIDKEHENYNYFQNLSEQSNVFKIEKYDYAIVLKLEDDLGKYLNKMEADKLIRKWFTESFDKIKKFTDDHKNLNWQLKK